MRYSAGPGWWHPESNPLRDIREFVLAAEQEYRDRHQPPESHRVPVGMLEEDIVESESSPGTFYHLRKLNDGTITCECQGYYYRQDCKHVQRRKEEGW